MLNRIPNCTRVARMEPGVNSATEADNSNGAGYIKNFLQFIMIVEGESAIANLKSESYSYTSVDADGGCCTTASIFFPLFSINRMAINEMNNHKKPIANPAITSL